MSLKVPEATYPYGYITDAAREGMAHLGSLFNAETPIHGLYAVGVGGGFDIEAETAGAALDKALEMLEHAMGRRGVETLGLYEAQVEPLVVCGP